MADERLKRDGNRVPVVGGITNDANEEVRALRLDDSTKRLLVSAVITSGGGSGTQYTEADTDASITGTAVMWEDTSDTLRAASVAKPLPVQLADGTDTATIRDVTGAKALDVSIVDGSGNQVTSFGGGTQYTEDAAAAANPVGTALIGVRADSLAGITSTDGDNVAARMTDKGELYVKHADTIAVTQSGTWDEVGINDSGNSITVDNGGTFAVQESGGALTALQLIDDTVATLGTTTYTETSTKGLTIGAVRRDADTTLVDTTNEIGPLQMDANGRLKVEAFSGEALPVTDNSSSLSVDWNGTQPVTGSGTATDALRVELPTNGTGVIATVSTVSALGTGTTGPMKAEDVAHSTGDMGIPAWTVANESNTARAANNDYLPIASDTEGNVRIVGNRDHDAVDAGEVVGIGGVAVAHGSNPTAVAAADRTRTIYNRHGVPFYIGGHPNIILKHLNVTDADGAQTNAALVTVATGNKIVVTHITVTADNANTTDVQCRIGFGTANTPSNDANAGVVLSHPGIPAGGGVQVGNGAGIIGVGADDEDLRITCEDPTGGSLDVVVGYYTIES